MQNVWLQTWGMGFGLRSTVTTLHLAGRMLVISFPLVWYILYIHRTTVKVQMYTYIYMLPPMYLPVLLSEAPSSYDPQIFLL